MADIEKIQPIGDSTQYNLKALSLKSQGRVTTANFDAWDDEHRSKITTMLASSSMDSSGTKPPCGDGYLLNFGWDTDAGWGSQLAVQHTITPRVCIRGCNGGTKESTWGNWFWLPTAASSGVGSSTVPVYITNNGQISTISSYSGNAATATKLSNTPNNTSTFLRGDNAWSNTLQNTNQQFIIKSTDTSSFSIYRLYCGDNNGLIFLNGTERADDGGANMMTIRNNSGDLRLDDNTYITGTIHCTAGTGNYCEGMRFERPDGQWVTIALGGTATSGTNANCWSIHRKSDNNFCISRNSSDGANGLVMTSTGMGLGTTAPVSRLTVNANGTDSVGAIRVIETRTDGGWHYPILCTSPSIPNGANTYICLGKACSTGNSAGVRWYHAGDNSNENLIGFEIWGVGTHLYCKRNTYSYATRMYGAVWNDYAEFRETKDIIEPGRCIKEVGDDTLVLTTERLEKGCEIVSDTYGFAIGESEKCKTPTAASGRVLAYLYEEREIAKQHIGDPVCSGPYGTISIMTEEEARLYPWCIIGTISAVPDYDIWHAGHNDENNVDIPIQVDGRIWIRIR